LRIIKEEGFGADCSSLPELLLAERVGMSGENIMLTSNETPAEEYRKARELGALINLDDLSHIDFLEKHVGLPELLSCRYNPGPLRSGNAIAQTKHGILGQRGMQGHRFDPAIDEQLS
jgi:diaminopimelate decarboxylase